MIISREEEGKEDLCLTRLRPTWVPLSSVLNFKLFFYKEIFSKTSQHLSWDEFNPPAGVKSDIANNKQR